MQENNKSFMGQAMSENSTKSFKNHFPITYFLVTIPHCNPNSDHAYLTEIRLSMSNAQFNSTNLPRNPES